MPAVRRPALLVGIEAGGTKFVCRAGRDIDEFCRGERAVVATGSPEGTMAEVAAWVHEAQSAHGERVGAVGVASFGPLDMARLAIGDTPKPGWSGFSWAAALDAVLPGVPFALDTDTGAAALAEWRWGAARWRDPAAYLTVGTGIGGGLVLGGRPLHGLVHPEVGHMRVRRQEGDDFPGTCPFHGDCLEGLACGPALEKRWGRRGEDLPADHPAWQLEASYLSQCVVNLVMTVSPQIVVMGGGIMEVEGLRDRVRTGVREMIGGYLASDLLGEHIDRFVVAPGLGADSGVLGAFGLAETIAGRRGRERG
jgi:fructokinase